MTQHVERLAWRNIVACFGAAALVAVLAWAAWALGANAATTSAVATNLMLFFVLAMVMVLVLVQLALRTVQLIADHPAECWQIDAATWQQFGQREAVQRSQLAVARRWLRVHATVALLSGLSAICITLLIVRSPAALPTALASGGVGMTLLLVWAWVSYQQQRQFYTRHGQQQIAITTSPYGIVVAPLSMVRIAPPQVAVVAINEEAGDPALLHVALQARFGERLVGYELQLPLPPGGTGIGERLSTLWQTAVSQPQRYPRRAVAALLLGTVLLLSTQPLIVLLGSAGSWAIGEWRLELLFQHDSATASGVISEVVTRSTSDRARALITYTYAVASPSGSTESYQGRRWITVPSGDPQAGDALDVRYSQADPAALRPVGGDRLFIVATVVTAALTVAVLLVLGGTFVLLRAGLRRLGPVLVPVPKG